MRRSTLIILLVVGAISTIGCCADDVAENGDDEDGNAVDVNLIETVEIEISKGIVRGRVGKTEQNRMKFYGFRGMRYAEPPKRFEPSVMVKPWKGVYDATQDRSSCIQIPEADNGIDESEDCLYINVYTPELPTISENTTLLPVMFWVHGGAQMNGDSTYTVYGPDYFLDDGVVMVTLNYRLGVFGFLSTGDLVCPGNNGLKDVILGLQWVQENIEYFGGDKDQVTIFGESAGGAMVMYLAQSPLTRGKGYFNKAIAQSGNTLCPWSFQRNPRDVANRIALATFCGLHIFDSLAMINCLKTVELSVLKLAALGVFLGDGGFLVRILNGLAFAPCLEPEHTNAAISENSYTQLKRGDFPKFPYIFGYNSEEAIIVADNLTLLRPLLLQIDAAPGILVPTDMNAPFVDAVLNIAPQIRNYYFDSAPITLNSNAKIIKYLSDHLFDRPTREIVSLIAKRAPVYFYRFSYFGKLGMFDTQIKGLGRVQHTADLNYLWRTNLRTVNNTNLSSYHANDLRTRRRLHKLWTNFAKYGNPTPSSDELFEFQTWPQAGIKSTNESDVLCLDIDENLTIVKNPENQQYKMWKKLYNKYGKPIDTY